MVIITINGIRKEREFQNMAQALAFAYQNGECHNAEKLEIAYAAGKTAEKTEQKFENKEGPEEQKRAPPVPEETTGTEIQDGGQPAEGAGGKPLEEMTRKELETMAKKLGVEVKTGAGGFFRMKDAELIAAIRAAEVPADNPDAEGGGGDNPDQTV